MQIDWWTVALQAINFLVLVWLLWRFLFKPVQAILARRRDMAAKASGELEEAKQEAAEEKRRYEAAREDLAGERRELINKIHKELEEERKETFAEARKEADEVIRAARQQIAEEREAALGSLREEVANLAADMAAHMLAQVSPETYSALLLEKITGRLQNLSEDERGQLKSDLAGGDTQVTVATAMPLDAASTEKWAAELRNLLDSAVEIEFEIKPELIAGAEVRLPHVAVTFSWAEELEEARKVLSEA